MPRNAKSRLTINIVIALGILIVLLLALFLVSRDVQTQATNIKTAKSDLKTKAQQLNDLARLREEAKKAQPNLVKLEAAIPDRDELFSVRKELEQLAGSNKLVVNFTFGNEGPKENNLGNINYELKLQGGDSGIRSFVDEVESSYPFVRITALDMVRRETDFNATLKGQILFNE